MYDPGATSFPERNVEGEEPWITIGAVVAILILAVAHTVRREKREQIVRVVSARKARHQKGEAMKKVRKTKMVIKTVNDVRSRNATKAGREAVARAAAILDHWGLSNVPSDIFEQVFFAGTSRFVLDSLPLFDHGYPFPNQGFRIAREIDWCSPNLLVIAEHDGDNSVGSWL